MLKRRRQRMCRGCGEARSSSRSSSASSPSTPGGVRWIEAPWSYPSLGPTLTGTWEGPLRARLGTEYRVLVTMEYRAEGRRRRFDRGGLTGRGWICSRQGDVYEYDLDGSASRSGDSVVMSLTYVDPVQSALGNRLEGSWSGQTLSLRPLFNPFQPDGTFLLHRTVSSADPDDSFAETELRPSDRATHLAACGRLQRRALPATFGPTRLAPRRRRTG